MRRNIVTAGCVLGGSFVFAATSLLAAQPQADTAVESSSISSAPWYETYRKAVADAELEEWTGVESKIAQAIKANPKSERNVRTYGMWHASYIPYFYLGLAEYHLGRPAEALKNLDREEAAGVVQHDPVAYLKLRKIAASIKSGSGAPPSPASTSGAPAPAKSAQTSAAAAPADKLVGGLQAFFQGNYDKSIALFQDEMKRTSREDLTLHLYLGMAYAGKASESPKDASVWRNLAFFSFQKVNEIDPNYALASGVFSEDMVSLFNDAKKKK
jgi:tetratricopeptide (TPR) repeat protein